MEPNRTSWYSKLWQDWSWQAPGRAWSSAFGGEKSDQAGSSDPRITLTSTSSTMLEDAEKRIRPSFGSRQGNANRSDRMSMYGRHRLGTQRLRDAWRKNFQETTIKEPKTIFEIHIPWKGETLDQILISVPEPLQPAIVASIKGDVAELQEALSFLPEGFDIPTIINARDHYGRCAIHFACGYGHFEVVKFLLDNGANPNELENSGCITPLKCASVIGEQKIMELLFDKGAEIDHGLKFQKPHATEGTPIDENLTALVWAVRAENANSVKYLLKKGATLTSRKTTDTPIHEASYIGNKAILKLLMRRATQLDLQTKRGERWNSALHVAAEQGHLDCAELLLTAKVNPNARNAYGEAPIHLAAKNNDTAMISLLVAWGADVNAKDFNERTPLHTCIYQQQKIDSSIETIETIDLLLNSEACIDVQDSNGLTPFHAAISIGDSSIVSALLKYEADLTICNRSGQSGIELLIKNMPHAISYIKDSLDFAVTVKNNKDFRDPDCTLEFNFRPFVVLTSDRNAPRKETELLLSFCDFGREILSHPIIEAFLILKWQKVKKYFWASFLANLLLVLTYSGYTFYVYAVKCPLRNRQANLTLSNWDTNFPVDPVESGILLATWIALFLMILVFAVKEFIQMVNSPLSYIRVSENWVQVTFAVLSMITILPEKYHGHGHVNSACDCGYLYERHHFYYTSASFCVIIAWLLTLLRIGKLPRLGLYVHIFFEVMRKFSYFIIAYSCILFGFALSLGILFDFSYLTAAPEGRQGFWFLIVRAVLTTTVWMTGELQYDSLLDPASLDRPLIWLVYILFVAFVLIVTVVLMNLLVGLAVSDIQGLRQGARVARLSRLVLSISNLESTLFSRGLAFVLPKTAVDKLRASALLVQRLNKCTYTCRPHDPRDKVIPKKVQQEAIRLLEKRESERVKNIALTNKGVNYKLQIIERLGTLESLVESINLKISSNPNASF